MPWQPATALDRTVLGCAGVVEARVRQILGELDLRESSEDQRRVPAVLIYLRS